MRPTRRGITVFAVLLLAIALLLTVGQPGLRVVVVGLGVVLLTGLGHVLWLRPPGVERFGPTPGHVGETRAVELRFDTPDSYLATVRDLGSRSLDGHERVASLGGDPLSYELSYDRRGAHRLGPVEVEAHDALGLFSREFTVGGETEVVVYPPVRALTGTNVGARALAAAAGAGVEREFDHLREYHSGDSPRDVDWRASAKRDELIVAEYDERGETAILIAAGGPSRKADVLAEAVASVAFQLFDAGTAVGIALSDERVSPSRDGDQRERLLEALARTEAGPLPDAEAAIEVRVLADGRVRIDTGNRMTTLDWPPEGGVEAPVGGEPA